MLLQMYKFVFVEDKSKSFKNDGLHVAPHAHLEMQKTIPVTSEAINLEISL